jgi:hypothetical protein
VTLRLTLLALSLFSADPRPICDATGCATARVAVAGDDSANRRQAIAERFAPTIYQETLDPYRDFIAAFDFDGDWDGSNNAEHVARYPLAAVIYYTVVETATHWFVQYVVYHPVDYKRIAGHPHDLESLLVAVRKDGAQARLEAVETRFHKVWYQYAPPGSQLGGARSADDLDGPVHLDADGHPAVTSQRAGHGLCGGLAPNAAIRELELTCDHGRAPALQRAGVVYRFGGSAEVPTVGAAFQTRRYALREIRGSLWLHLRDRATFGDAFDYAGDRCSIAGVRCPHGIGRSFACGAERGDADAPWAQTPGRGGHATGDQFFDPAGTLDRRLKFPRPYALEYSFNPYLGIGGDPRS